MIIARLLINDFCWIVRKKLRQVAKEFSFLAADGTIMTELVFGVKFSFGYRYVTLSSVLSAFPCSWGTFDSSVCEMLVPLSGPGERST